MIVWEKIVKNQGAWLKNFAMEVDVVTKLEYEYKTDILLNWLNGYLTTIVKVGWDNLQDHGTAGTVEKEQHDMIWGR